MCLYESKSERDVLWLHPVANDRIRLWGGFTVDKLHALVMKRKVGLGQLCE